MESELKGCCQISHTAGRQAVLNRMSVFKILTLALLVGWVVGCQTCPPLSTEQWAMSRNTGWKSVLPDETAPEYSRLVGALMNEGFIVSITNAIPTGRVRFPGAETNHKVVLFRRASVSGVLEHYRDSRMDYFTLHAHATNQADPVRCNYYRFKAAMLKLIEAP